METEWQPVLCAPGAQFVRGSPGGALGAPLPRDLGWRWRGSILQTVSKLTQPLALGQLGLGQCLSLPCSRGQALIASFRGLCSAHPFILGPTQCRGEGRSDLQPSALDFLSFVGWRTAYATRLPVISALGVPTPWRRSALGGSEELLGGEDRGHVLGSQSLGLLLDTEGFSRSLVIDNAFLWDLNSDSIPKATYNTSG